MMKITLNTNKAKEISNLYDLTANTYNRRYKEIQEAKIKIIIKYSLNISKKIVLDAGCGTGHLKSFLNKKTTYVGIDLSQNMLKEFKDENNIIRADLTSLPFIDNSFDEVYCITVLQNIENKTRAVSELKRVAKIKGRILVSILRKTYKKEKCNEWKHKNIFYSIYCFRMFFLTRFKTITSSYISIKMIYYD